MSRLTILMILGILVALSPYLGVPLSTLAIILPVLGLVIVAIAVTIKMRDAERARQALPQPALSYEAQEA